MTKTLEKESTQNEALSSKLLTTLEEGKFFNEMAKFVKTIVEFDSILINIVHDDKTTRIVSKDGKIVKNADKVEKNFGALGSVIKSSRPYFSNTVKRDPIYSGVEVGDVEAELTIPVSVEGVMIAVMQVRRVSSENKFKREDINKILEMINSISLPLKNMKMYLSAKFLNEALEKKIKDKESEIENNHSGLNLVKTYSIEEKEIIGNSSIMKELLSNIDRVSESDVNILLQGNSGTGKEMIARRVHCRSDRSAAPFIVMDCSMGTEDHLDLEIFGKEDIDVINGLKVRPGLLERADGGTLFINNVNKMPIRLQSKLINFIKDKSFQRCNGHKTQKANVRIVSASTECLKTKVSEGTFREDLFYAISFLGLRVPSLNERLEDIEALATYFLNKDKAVDKQKSMSPGVVKLLMDYHWPGNVRELQSIMERAYILSPSSIVERDHLADSIKVEKEAPVKEVKVAEAYREMTLNDLEKEHITRTLEHLGGNKTKTAKVLGITVKTLYNKLHSYGVVIGKEA